MRGPPKEKLVVQTVSDKIHGESSNGPSQPKRTPSRTSQIILSAESSSTTNPPGQATEKSAVTTQHQDAAPDLGAQDDDDTVWWDTPKDQQNPMNWSAARKWTNITIVSILTFLTMFGSSAFAPAVNSIMRDFDSHNDLLSGFVVSIYVLGFAFGPLTIAPMSELYGRLPAYYVCGILFTGFTLGCAMSRNIGQLIAFRFLAGSAGSTPLALAGGTIADISKPEMKATAMTVWSLGPTVGPVIAPIAGAFISSRLGWRWNFWIVVIAMGALGMVSLLFLRETYPPTLLADKARRLRKATGNPDLRSRLADPSRSSKSVFFRAISRPARMLLFSPTCFSQSLYVAVVYSYMLLFFTTISDIFESKYHFRHDFVGLSFLGLGLGSLSGQIIGNWVENRRYAYHKAKGDLVPEHRLYNMVPGAIMLPMSLFWYGWSIEKGVHWICPIIATAVFGIGLSFIFMAAVNYLIDVFTLHAASAMAANTILRSLVAALLPIAGSSLYSKLGYGWGSSLLVFLALAAVPIPFLFLRSGAWIRLSKENLRL